MAIHILIADDYRIVREGLRLLLTSDTELHIDGEATSGIEAIEKARYFRPDVVLMDTFLPVLDGIGATAIIRRELPATEVLLLIENHDNLTIINAIRAGAIGYVLKDSYATDMRTAIRAAAAGQVYLSPLIADAPFLPTIQTL